MIYIQPYFLISIKVPISACTSYFNSFIFTDQPVGWALVPYSLLAYLFYTNIFNFAWIDRYLIWSRSQWFFERWFDLFRMRRQRPKVDVFGSNDLYLIHLRFFPLVKYYAWSRIISNHSKWNSTHSPFVFYFWTWFLKIF